MVRQVKEKVYYLFIPLKSILLSQADNYSQCSTLHSRDFLVLAICIAVFIADFILDGSAIFRPAISKAVP